MDNKKLKSSWAAAFTVASVWFGTHVGAGFATGNQVVNYFVQYGWTAAIFPLLAMGILAVVMYIMMKFAKLSGFDNYKDTYRALYPKPWMEIFFEVFYIIIILAAVASCVDGAGGIVKSLIDLPDIICNLVIIALLILLSIFGVDPILCAIKSTGVDTVASIAARHIGDVMKLPNQSVVTLMGSGYTWLFVVYTILLFCAFVSTSVTLVYSMIQRFEGHCFPKAIKSKAARSVIVGLIVIGLCYAVSLLGLSTIISKIYGYDGYYALIVVVLPAFIWGIPKIKKLSAEKKAELSE